MASNLARRIKKLELLASVGTEYTFIDALKAVDAVWRASEGDKERLEQLRALPAPDGEPVNKWARVIARCRQLAVGKQGDGSHPWAAILTDQERAEREAHRAKLEREAHVAKLALSGEGSALQ